MHTRQTIMLYDGWCSLCTHTANKLTNLDTQHNGIDNQQIKAIDFRKDPKHIEQHNLDPAQIRKVLHAITPDDQVLTAMDALRHCMKQVGRGWQISWTALPVLRTLTDKLYTLFANNRHRLPSKSKCEDDTCTFK